MRLLGRDRVLDDLREADDRARERRLGRAGQGTVDPVGGRQPGVAALRRIEAIRACAYWT